MLGCGPRQASAVTRLVLVLLLAGVLAGCVGSDRDVLPSGPADAPYMGYRPEEPDAGMAVHWSDHWIPSEGAELHVRVLRPSGAGPFPVIATLYPYSGMGIGWGWNATFHPHLVGETGYVDVFVRRGYALAHVDMRGVGDSSGCADFMGSKDLADAWNVVDWLASRSWSTGKVGLQGVWYSGALLGALGGHPSLAAVSLSNHVTSVYHEQHMGGVPFQHSHSLQGNNLLLTEYALHPTVNGHYPGHALRLLDKSNCPHVENALLRGSLAQTGEYDDWWAERDYRELEGRMSVPIIIGDGMLGLRKPAHTAAIWNSISAPKTLVVGQWWDVFPLSACAAGQESGCEDRVPYRDWWEYVVSFFDTYLKEIPTGMFGTDVAWIEDNTGVWHRSDTWPIAADARDEVILHLRSDGSIAASAGVDPGERSWYGCPRDRNTFGHPTLRMLLWAERALCDRGGLPPSLSFTSIPFEEDVVISGVPRLTLTLESEVDFTHVTAVLYVVNEHGGKVGRLARPMIDLDYDARISYAYLNPTYREGPASARPIVPGETYSVTMEFAPLESVVKAGESLELVIASHDGGHGSVIERSAPLARTVEYFDAGANTIRFGAQHENWLELHLRPAALQGTRLD